MAEKIYLGMYPAMTAEAAVIRAGLAAVPCPYATGLDYSVWCALVQNTPDAHRFLMACAAAGCSPGQAFAIELGHATPTDVRSLRYVVHPVLKLIGDDPAEARADELMAENQWWLRSGGHDWFVTVHANFYAPNHSRHWPRPAPIIVLVPQVTFTTLFARGISADARRAVRAAFASVRQFYPAAGGAIATHETR